LYTLPGATREYINHKLTEYRDKLIENENRRHTYSFFLIPEEKRPQSFLTPLDRVLAAFAMEQKKDSDKILQELVDSDYDIFSLPSIKQSFSQINYLENLAKEFINALKQHGYGSIIEDYRKRRTETWLSEWHSCLFPMNNPLFYKSPYQNLNTNQYLKWPLVVDAFCRDHDLLFGHLFKPFLIDQRFLKNKKASYQEILDEIEKLFPDTLSANNYMNPQLRNSFIRHQYIVSPRSLQLSFFSDFDKDPEYEIGFQKFYEITMRQNQLFWTFILLQPDCTFLQDFKDEPFLAMKTRISTNDLTKTVANSPLGEFIEKRMFKIDFDVIFRPKTNNETPLYTNFLVQALKESIQFYGLVNKLPGVKQSYYFFVFEKIGYLLGYSALLATLRWIVITYLDPQAKYLDDYLESLETVKGGVLKKYLKIFTNMKRYPRNALAHNSYFTNDLFMEITYREFNQDTKTLEEKTFIPFSPDGPFRSYIALDAAFIPELQENFVDIVAGELIYLAFRPGEYLKKYSPTFLLDVLKNYILLFAKLKDEEMVLLAKIVLLAFSGLYDNWNDLEKLDLGCMEYAYMIAFSLDRYYRDITRKSHVHKLFKKTASRILNEDSTKEQKHHFCTVYSNYLFQIQETEKGYRYAQLAEKYSK
jgi:hypothetical protein